MTGTLPGATTRIDETAGPVAVGTKLCAFFAPVPLNASGPALLHGNAASIYANHGYAQGVDEAALFIEHTGLPVMFVPMPIATPGVVGRVNQSGNTNTSAVTCTVGPYGSLEECDVVVRANNSGTIGTTQMFIDLSLDGGTSFTTVRLGTANSYTIPYVGLVLAFGAGALTAGETVLTCHSTAPMWDSAGMTAAKNAMANQMKQVRAWQVVGDISTSTQAGHVSTAVNAYETGSERFCQAKAALRDRLPAAALSQSRVSMTGSPNITFAEVGATGDTITRSAGSFVTDGFVAGDTIRVTGAVATGGANNVTGVVVTVAPTVLTLGSTDLENEGPISGVSITSEPTLTFAEVGATGDTITRSRGSWLADGFAIGDKLVVTGTASNNITAAAGLTGVAALVLTLDTDDLAAEVIGSYGVSVTAGETKAQHVAALDAAMATVTSQKRLELGFGRDRILSPFNQSMLRRSAILFDTIRAFQRDVHVATWKKSRGSLPSAGLVDTNGTLVEHDERVDGGALAAGFTCLCTWPNDSGAYIAKSLTRIGTASPLVNSFNMAIANIAQATAQAETENAIGESLTLKADGTAEPASLNVIKQRVDSALKRNLLANVENEGKRASNAFWTPSSDDDLSGADATLTAVLSLFFNGVLVRINTLIKINPGA